MNSHSSRRLREESVSEEIELTGLLNLHPEGSEFTSVGFDGIFNTHFEPVDLALLRTNYGDHSQGRRVSPRYGLRVTVLISNHQRAFRTQTENASYAGLLIKDHLPESFHNGSFDVLLIDESRKDKKQYVLFRGKVVLGPKSSNRIVFEAFTNDSEKKLTELFSDLTQV